MIEEVISLKDLVTGPAKDMGAAVTKLSGDVKGLSSSMLESVPAAESMWAALEGPLAPLIAIASAIAVAVTGLAGLTYEMAETALEAVELKEKLLATFSALGGGEEAGRATLGMLNDLSDRLGVTRASLVDTAKAFQAMGYTELGPLSEQIKATTSAQALFGESGAEAYKRISSAVKDAAEAHTKLTLSSRQLRAVGGVTGTVVTAAAKSMGLTTAQFAAQLKAGTLDAGKFGDALHVALVEQGRGPLEAMANSLPNLVAKAKENLSRLFEDVDIKPFTDAVRSFFDVFSLGQPSGQAMKAGIVPVMNKIFEIAGKVVMAIKHITLEMVILGLKAYIALKPIVKSVTELSERFHVAHGLILLAKGVMILLAAATAIAFVPLVLLAAAISAVVAGIGAAISAVQEFAPKAAAALSDWASSAAEYAANFIDGLVNGIRDGISHAVAAVSDLGTSIKDGIKGILGIHSPSKVMLELGGHVAGGFAAGISAGSRRVGESAENMAYAANDNVISASSYARAPAPTAPVAASPGGSNSSTTVNVMPGAVVIHEAGDAKSVTEEAIGILFERVALSQGA
jgi:hypothetical protein